MVNLGSVRFGKALLRGKCATNRKYWLRNLAAGSFISSLQVELSSNSVHYGFNSLSAHFSLLQNAQRRTLHRIITASQKFPMARLEVRLACFQVMKNRRRANIFLTTNRCRKKECFVFSQVDENVSSLTRSGVGKGTSQQVRWQELGITFSVGAKLRGLHLNISWFYSEVCYRLKEWRSS